MDSHLTSTSDFLKTLLPKDGIDFLFIDGDHRYDGVKMDFEMYSPLLRPGGLVRFHDICTNAKDKTCGVDRFWLEIRTKSKTGNLLIIRNRMAMELACWNFRRLWAAICQRNQPFKTP